MKTETIIREYNKQDKETLLNLLRLNTPAFFSPEEEKDFIYYLDNEVEYYFVIELENKIIGCGGFNFSGNPAIGTLSWDIFHPDYQGKGLGQMLVNYRIEKIQQFKDIRAILVNTSQLAWQFYQKQGFKLNEVIEDYWAKGFDLYEMEYAK